MLIWSWTGGWGMNLDPAKATSAGGGLSGKNNTTFDIIPLNIFHFMKGNLDQKDMVSKKTITTRLAKLIWYTDNIILRIQSKRNYFDYLSNYKLPLDTHKQITIWNLIDTSKPENMVIKFVTI